MRVLFSFARTVTSSTFDFTRTTAPHTIHIVHAKTRTTHSPTTAARDFAFSVAVIAESTLCYIYSSRNIIFFKYDSSRSIFVRVSLAGNYNAVFIIPYDNPFWKLRFPSTSVCFYGYCFFPA